jgi:hypothetical protein
MVYAWQLTIQLSAFNRPLPRRFWQEKIMWEMFTSSMQMFLKGKLFRDNVKVFTQGAIGVLVAIALIILLGKFVHLPMWAAALIGGLASGALMPYLFKDLKYA